MTDGFETLLKSFDKTESNALIQTCAIEDFNSESFEDILDLRTLEEFSENHIVGSTNIPMITKSEIEQIVQKEAHDNSEKLRYIVSSVW